MAEPTQLALIAATAALVPAVYGAALPPLSEVRGQADDRGHLSASWQMATLAAAGLVVGLAYVGRSREAAALGGAVVAGYALAYRHAIELAP